MPDRLLVGVALLVTGACAVGQEETPAPLIVVELFESGPDDPIAARLASALRIDPERIQAIVYPAGTARTRQRRYRRHPDLLGRDEPLPRLVIDGRPAPVDRTSSDIEAALREALDRPSETRVTVRAGFSPEFHGLLVDTEVEGAPPDAVLFVAILETSPGTLETSPGRDLPRVRSIESVRVEGRATNRMEFATSDGETIVVAFVQEISTLSIVASARYP